MQNWIIEYTDGQGETKFITIHGSSAIPSKNEVAIELLEKLIERVYERNSAESLKKHANMLLESEGCKIVSIDRENVSA